MCDLAQYRLWLEATSKLKGDFSERGEGQVSGFQNTSIQNWGCFLGMQKKVQQQVPMPTLARPENPQEQDR